MNRLSHKPSIAATIINQQLLSEESQ